MTANMNLPPIATKAGIRARMGLVDPRTKAILAAALDLVDQTEARAARRAFLQRGWARALLHDTSADLEKQACRLRGRHMPNARPGHEDVAGRFAIAVAEADDDPWAAQYQRVAFRRKRIRRALGQDGLAGHAVYGDKGFVRTDQSIVDDWNTNAMQDMRRRAQRAKQRAADKRNPGDVIGDAMGEWSAEQDARDAWGGY